MRAARFHEWGAAPVVEDVPGPVRADGEVLVRVEAAAVAHLDVTISGGDFALKPSLPYTGGVEGAGVVLESDDDGLAPGTQVMLRGGGLGSLRDGTWAERISVPRKAVTALDPPLAPEVAATFFVPATTGYVAVRDVARVDSTDHVIVVGAAGAVGAMAVQQALAAGATVTGVVGRPERVPDVPKGAEPLALASDDAIAELAGSRSASVLIDTLGGDGLLSRTAWVRPGGRAVVIGYVTGPRAEIDLPSWLLEDVALLPVNMIRQERRARQIAPDLVRQLSAGELEVAVERFSLTDIARALDALRSGQLRGRAVVIPEGAAATGRV
jgi:NADPH2:quinone reductase